MNDKQPEALIWAQQLELLLPFMSPATFIASTKAIAELRRLHEVNAELVEALYAVEAWLSTGEGTGFQNKVSAAIAKAQGETALQRLNKAAEDNREEL